MRLKRVYIVFVAFVAGSFAFSSAASAARVHLKNGDVITGDIAEENKGFLSVETGAMGTVSVNRDFVKEIEGFPAEEDRTVKAAGEESAKKDIAWTRKLSAGYNAARGNTDTNELSAALLINRNRVHANESTLKGNIYYSEVDDRADAQKWHTMGRYAFSFGPRKRWYNFYRVEYEHDRFAEIRYRLTPGTGAGYWFFDEPGLKLLAELGAGYQRTDYIGEKETSDEIIWLPRAFGEVEMFENVRASGDLYLYPTVNFDEFRLRAESALAAAVNSFLSIRIAIINDYNTDNPEDAEEHDMRVESSLVASF